MYNLILPNKLSNLTSLLPLHQTIDDTAADVLDRVAPVEELRQQLFDANERLARLEERNQALEATASGRAGRLQAEVDALAARLEVAEASEAEARARIAQLQEQDAQGGTPHEARVRRSEDRFVAEAQLRDRLAATQRELAGVKAELAAKANAVMDLRLEVERRTQQIGRLQRRLDEMAQLKELLGRRGVGAGAGVGVGGGAGLGAGASAGTTRRGAKGTDAKRVAELEGVVAHLTKVADDRKAEVERLRSRAGRPGAGGDSRALKTRVKEATARAKRLEEEVEELRERATDADKVPKQHACFWRGGD